MAEGCSSYCSHLIVTASLWMSVVGGSVHMVRWSGVFTDLLPWRLCFRVAQALLWWGSLGGVGLLSGAWGTRPLGPVLGSCLVDGQLPIAPKELIAPLELLPCGHGGSVFLLLRWACSYYCDVQPLQCSWWAADGPGLLGLPLSGSGSQGPCCGV